MDCCWRGRKLLTPPITEFFPLGRGGRRSGWGLLVVERCPDPASSKHRSFFFSGAQWQRNAQAARCTSATGCPFSQMIGVPLWPVGVKLPSKSSASSREAASSRCAASSDTVTVKVPKTGPVLPSDGNFMAASPRRGRANGAVPPPSQVHPHQPLSCTGWETLRRGGIASIAP